MSGNIKHICCGSTCPDTILYTSMLWPNYNRIASMISHWYSWQCQNIMSRWEKYLGKSLKSLFLYEHIWGGIWHLGQAWLVFFPKIVTPPLRCFLIAGKYDSVVKTISLSVIVVLLWQYLHCHHIIDNNICYIQTLWSLTSSYQYIIRVSVVLFSTEFH